MGSILWGKRFTIQRFFAGNLFALDDVHFCLIIVYIHGTLLFLGIIGKAQYSMGFLSKPAIPGRGSMFFFRCYHLMRRCLHHRAYHDVLKVELIGSLKFERC